MPRKKKQQAGTADKKPSDPKGEPIVAEAAPRSGPESSEPASAEPTPVEPDPAKNAPAASSQCESREPRSDTRAAFLVFAKALHADLQRLGRRAAGKAAKSSRHFKAWVGQAANKQKISLADGKPAADYLRGASRRFGQSISAGAGAFRRSGASRPRWRIFALKFVIPVLVLLAAGIGTAIWALHDVPFAEVIAGTSEAVVVLESADGEVLVQTGSFQDGYAAREEFPDHLVQAVLSIEDRGFYSHYGLSVRGLARAMVRNVGAGRVVEGGSTITQQLVKILYLERDRTLRRKIQEAVLALWLESRLDKDEILTRYLNNIYLGAGATGMPAAALVYFGKSVGELTLSESAILAGLIKAPSQLNPLQDPEAARERAALVLAAMGEAGHLSDAEVAEAQAVAVALNPSRADGHAGNWFADWVMADAREIAGPFRGTIRVKTTLVPELQAIAEKVVGEALAGEGKDRRASQAALVALAPNGAVVAMVGGRDYDSSEFNRAASAKRQPGSTFKLFVYYAALRAGYSPGDSIEDSPVDIDGWTPENYNGRYNGRVSLASAFARSLNAATVRLAMDVGIDKVAETARLLGVDAELGETPSMALGSSEINLLDLTGAYASVRAGIAPIEPWGILSFAADETEQRFRIGPAKQPEHDLSEHHRILIGMLKLVVDRGTGKNAALDGFAAGKTGTSQDSKDAWFVGFNEMLTVGVWVGNDDGEPMDKVTGGQLPATIWRNFMNGAAATTEPKAPAMATQVKQNVTQEAGQSAGSDRPAQQQTHQAPICNIRACSRAYRSFRSSDCTFQPYRGGRKLCEK